MFVIRERLYTHPVGDDDDDDYDNEGAGKVDRITHSAGCEGQ